MIGSRWTRSAIYVIAVCLGAPAPSPGTAAAFAASIADSPPIAFASLDIYIVDVCTA